MKTELGKMVSREISILEIDPFIIQRVVIELLCARHCLVLRIQRAPQSQGKTAPQSGREMDTDNPSTLRDEFRRTHGKSAKGTVGDM